MITAIVAFIKYFLGINGFRCCYLIFTIRGEVVIATLY